MQSNPRIDAVYQGIDRLYAPGQIFGKSGVIRLVDLQILQASAHQFFQLEVHDPRDIQRKLFLAFVELVANPFDERVRAGDAELCRAIGIGSEELEIWNDTKGGHRHSSAHDALVKIVVKLLGRTVDLDARKAFGKIVDQIVAAEFAVRDDVYTGHLLVFDGGFDGSIVDFVQFQPADAAHDVFRLQTFQPARHRIASHNSRGQERQTHDVTPVVLCRGSTFSSLCDT